MKDFYRVLGMFYFIWKDLSKDEEIGYGKKGCCRSSVCFV